MKFSGFAWEHFVQVRKWLDLNTHKSQFNHLTASACMWWNSLLMFLLLCHCSVFVFFEWLKVLQQDASCFHYPAAQERSKACLSVAKALRHWGWLKANPRENAHISYSVRAHRDLWGTWDSEVTQNVFRIWKHVLFSVDFMKLKAFPQAERKWRC